MRVLPRRVVIERSRRISLPMPASASDGGSADRPAVERNVIELARVSAAELEREGSEAGFRPEPALVIEPTDEHVGSAGGDAACLSPPPPLPPPVPPADRVLRVCALYPDLMNIYADRGNLLVLEHRCAWRGIGFELSSSGLGEPLQPDAHDLYYLGGGQDRDQRLCAEDLIADQARRAPRRRRS